MKIGRFIRTISHLRWRQIAYRPWRVAQKLAYRRFPRLISHGIAPGHPAPHVTTSTRLKFRSVLLEDLTHLAPDRETIEHQHQQLRAGQFSFLNQTLELGTPDWNRRHGSHLWNFQLHYFPFTLGCAQRYLENRLPADFAPCRHLIENWIEKARPGVSDGWDAYPLSVRVVNWIFALTLLADDYPDQDFLDRWRGSIWRQLDYLSNHLEYHLLANHLFRNIRALVIGGLFFDNLVWLRRGEKLLWQELDEQVLPDGGHFERAPMYHAQTLSDVIECVALLRHFSRPLPAGTTDRIVRMTDFLEALSYRDGRLALFNDSASTAETLPQPIIRAARRIAPRPPGPTPNEFPSTGYYTWESADGDEKIIVDAGPPSVAYNAAHAHCDLLSFELRLGGRPLIVDTGVHGYGGDLYREYCRSTRAHNTIRIDGAEQSEIWGTFRMGGMAQPAESSAISKSDQWHFHGAAYPFNGHLINGQLINSRRSGSLRHDRRITRDAAGVWTIEDRIDGAGFSFVESFLHLHPEVRLTIETDRSAILHAGALKYRLITFGETDRVSTKWITATDGSPDGWYFPEFGVALASRMLVVRFTGTIGEPFGFRIVPITTPRKA